MGEEGKGKKGKMSEKEKRKQERVRIKEEKGFVSVYLKLYWNLGLESSVSTLCG